MHTVLISLYYFGYHNDDILIDLTCTYKPLNIQPNIVIELYFNCHFV